MRLVNFSVGNYRSITSAHSVELSQRTVLIGKNNEGKSNILRALDAAMSILTRYSARHPALKREYVPYHYDYDWKRDFPVQLQGKKRTGKLTTFRLEFELSEAEIEEFKKAIGVNLNGHLPLEISVGSADGPEFRILKAGRGTKTLTSKSTQVAKFIADRIHFNYIPAVRTDKETTELIHGMLAHELRGLEEDPEYLDALNVIARIQKPVLDAIARRVEAPLKEFLPTVKSVSIEIRESDRKYSLRRNVSVIVDDGTPTNLEYKGDGVKSLAALGLLKNSNARSGASILAIEEPESHLHPGAIHQVNEIIRTIASDHQVILTTHNPLFVDRELIAANIMVADGGAKPAKSIKAIRDMLGIRASDNLMHANYALVVEGQEDVIALKSLLAWKSQKLQHALKSNILVIEPLGGAGNLSYKLSQLHSALCATHSLLDNDDAGRKAFEQAQADGVATIASTTFTVCNGSPDAEFEDMIHPRLYAPKIQREFGVDVTSAPFRGNAKWSVRMKNGLSASGKPNSETWITKMKYLVAEAIQEHPEESLIDQKATSFVALVGALENLVKV